MDRVDPAKSETATQKPPARGPHIRRVITPPPTHRMPAAGSPSRLRPAQQWVDASRSLSTSLVPRAKTLGLMENCYRSLGEVAQITRGPFATQRIMPPLPLRHTPARVPCGRASRAKWLRGRYRSCPHRDRDSRRTHRREYEFCLRCEADVTLGE